MSLNSFSMERSQSGDEVENDFTIRSVTPSDAEHWQRLRCELWLDGLNDHPEEIASFLAGTAEEPNSVFVAIDASDRLIGFVEVSVRINVPGLEGQKTGFIEGLYVTPLMRGRGVARALIRAARNWTKSQGYKSFASDRSDRFVIDKRFR